ncbi:MAG: hypothetical protein HC942_29865 [Microcoleus sp. SU_5_6]|nr:hypothetical protein [Microcoleus sp. SU_5_6]
MPSEFEAAKLFLNEGLNAATHPKMGQFLPSEGSDWTQNVAVFQDWGQQQPATRSPALDSIDFHWSGNIASLVSRTAGAIGQTMGRGMRKMKDFFK